MERGKPYGAIVRIWRNVLETSAPGRGTPRLGGAPELPLRIAFVTIGQTPRTDLVPEMVADITAGRAGKEIETREFGVLDGLDAAQLDAMRAAPGEPSFATRLRSGEEIVTSIARTEARLNALLARIDAQRFDLVVVLCTGTRIEPLANTLVVEAQRVVDATVAALAASSRRLGVMVPLERQVETFAARHDLPDQAIVVAASPYADPDFARSSEALAACDLVVMHCMGYSSAMHARVRDGVPAPVLLSRRIVSGAVRQLI